MRDKPVPFRRMLWLVGLSMLFVASAMAAPKMLGVPTPPGAKPAEANRVESPLDYRATIRWMERRLSNRKASVSFETIVDLPEVVAAHAVAPSAKTKWSGINVSRYGGKVWIFVIARGATVPSP